MTENVFGGSVSANALQKAIEELEKEVAGRIDGDKAVELFGERMARLREFGILPDVMVRRYAAKAAEEEGAGLVDEVQQARLIVSRYDERPAKVRRKRKPKDEEGEQTERAPESAIDDVPGEPDAPGATRAGDRTGSFVSDQPDGEPDDLAALLATKSADDNWTR